MEAAYRNRRVVSVESAELRVTVTIEGGHIAAIADKATGVNPLWTPPWRSIEPSACDPAHPAYGGDAGAKLLAGILGHNLCLDLFGPPSEEESAAGLTVHGESSVAPYDLTAAGGELVARADFPIAQLRFERRLRVEGRIVRIVETVENTACLDRPIAWTQHVTLGPPFVEPGVTQFRASATRSKTFEADFTGGKGYMPPGVEFDWPFVPRLGGGTVDMRTFIDAPVSAAFSTHLMDPKREQAYFLAFHPKLKMLAGYVWRQSDFPWLGIWEENRSRTEAPWNGAAIARGMEFGVSPMPEPRRKMIERRDLFGVPAYRWIGAKRQLQVEYLAFLMPAGSIPEEPPVEG